MVASGQYIPIVGEGNSKVEFVHPSKDKPDRVVQPADVLHIPGRQSNLVSLHAMQHAKEPSFCGGNSEILLFDGNLIVPAMGNLCTMTAFPLTTRRLRKPSILRRISVLGCSAESDDDTVDAEMGSDSQSDESLNESAHQAVDTPAGPQLKEVDFKCVFKRLLALLTSRF